jgi:8-amino-7-oxononanoate synthase
MDDLLAKRIQARKDQNAYRSLQPELNLVDFFSNDYLGIARSTELFHWVEEELHRRNIFRNGSTGSRLLSGNSSYAEELEVKLADIFSAPSAVLMNSGYAANTAVLSSLPQKNDLVLYDELSHASIKDGARLCLAKKFSFKHNDLNDLERKLKQPRQHAFIVVESVYSMDGDRCPLKELVMLAEANDATIILDEAHSTGIIGNHGSGLAVAEGLAHKIGVRIYTFGKAMGTHGACICGSTVLKEYLINFARPFIYTTALPPHNMASIDGAFHLLNQHPEWQTDLWKNIELFAGRITKVNSIKGASAIQSVVLPGNNQTKEASVLLRTRGFDVRPILSPTVQLGKERLRVCIHRFNTQEEILQLADEINKLTVS